ncbi:MAG: hypothetical protein RBT61_02320 [Candidatus Kapabacteria bacterium]|nr:hypothetical protein [Candidatus Kapabacteria bacterium]
MSKLITRYSAIIAILLSLAIMNLHAEPNQDDPEIRKDLKERMPFLMNSNNAGTLFYLAFHPCWEEVGENNNLRIYVSSPVATTVTVEVPGIGFFQQKQTKPNDVIDFMLTPSQGQPYTKTDRVPPQPEQIWEGRAVIVRSDDPIIVYGVTRFQYTSDGYLALPVSSLGNNYQVSSYADPTNNTIQWLTSYTSIVGIYDNTRVTFRMGGCENCFALAEDGSYITYNQSVRRTLNEGDVWLIPGIGPFNDLSGSTVKANKPVNVISGSFCAYIPSPIAYCDFISEQELPENIWGTKYHVTPIHTRKNYSIIKVFVKKPYTQFSIDGSPNAVINSPGGILGTGYVEIRAGVMNPGDVAPKPVEISSNEPIYVVQFNPGQQDDNIENDPFQLVLTPTEQYQKEIVFNTPGIRGLYGFKNNFLNIVYKATEEGGMPADLEFAEVVDGQFNWTPMTSYSGNPGERFVTTEEDGRFYRSKFIRLPYDGVFKLRSKDPVAAYAYGSDNADSYGWPVSVATADLETPDSLAPVAEYAKGCDGDVAGSVTDEPRVDPENRSNLALVYMDTDDSYNYIFEYDPFISGMSPSTNWTLKVRDASLNGQAHLVFMDRAGNRSDTIIEHYALNPVIEPYYSDYGTFKLENPNLEKSVTFTIRNESNSPITSNYDIFVVLDSDEAEGKAGDITTYQNFDIVDISGVNLAPMAVGQERNFEVKFTAREEGSFRDSVGVKVIDKNTGEVCVYQYFAEVKAFVGTPFITSVDKNFFEQVVNKRTVKYDLTVTNPNTGDYRASTSLKITGIEFSGDEIGHGGSDAVFEVEGLNNVSEANPIELAPGASRTFSVSFMPKEVRDYQSVITFIADAELPKNTSILNGRGIQPGLLVNSDDWGERLVDPNSYIQKGGTWDYTPYPSPNGAITLSNDGSAAVTLKTPAVESDVNGSAFKVLVNGNYVSLTEPGTLDNMFTNKSINPGENLKVDVYFDPKVSGDHELVLSFPSDAVTSPTSTLMGIGVYPKSSTGPLDFGHSIVGQGVVTQTVDFRAVEWQYDYPVTITDFVAAPANGATTISEFGGNGIMRWDRNSLKDQNGNVVTLPVILQPGDYLTMTGEFEPTADGSFEATLTTVSDAEEEAVSVWTATAEVQGAVMSPAEGETCLNSPMTLRPTITNTGTTELEVLNVRFVSTNPDFIQSDLELQNIPPFTLAPGATEELVIIYNPKMIYTNEVIRVIVTTNSTSQPEVETTVTISSEHVIQHTFSKVSNGGAMGTEDRIEVDPGQGDAVSYTIFINTTNPVPLSESMVFEAKVTYSKNFLGLGYHDRAAKDAKVQIGTQLASLGWTVSAEVTDFNEETNEEEITLTFVGAAPLKGSYGNLEIATITFDAFLPWYKDGDGNVKMKNEPVTMKHVILNNDPCVNYTADYSEVALNPTCVDNLRPIQISAVKYGLQPIAPNPVGASGADVNFSVGGNNIFTEIKLYNSSSELVSTIFSGTLNPGEYSARIPVENLSSGMYFIEMVSGPFSSGYEKLIINK